MSVQHLRLRHYRSKLSVRLASGKLWASGRIGRDFARFTVTTDQTEFGYHPIDHGYRCYRSDEADHDLATFQIGPGGGAARTWVTVTTPTVQLRSVQLGVSGRAVRRILTGPVLWGFDLVDPADATRLSARRRRGVVELTTDLDRRVAICVTTALLARHV